MLTQMNYSSILSDENDRQTADKDKDKYTERRRLIEQYVQQHQYIKLKCDYYGTDMYYYDARNKQMYKVETHIDWTGRIAPIFEPSNDAHILALNSLT